VFSSEGKGKNPLFLLVIVYSAAVQFVWLNFADHSAEWVPYKLYQGQELPYYY